MGKVAPDVECVDEAVLKDRFGSKDSVPVDLVVQIRKERVARWCSINGRDMTDLGPGQDLLVQLSPADDPHMGIL